MKKTPSIILGVGILALFLILIFGGSKGGVGNTTPSTTDSVENTVIKDGIQYVTITARGGYTPRTSSAKAGIPTKLIVKTNDTFDCSASLSIRAVGFQKILPQTGDTEIDIGIPKVGVPLQGICGMGMYSFIVNFS